MKCGCSFYQERQACRNEIHIGGGELKRGASEASKNGGPGACPKENVSSTLDRWKASHFGKCAIDGSR